MASSSTTPRVLVTVLNWNGADDTLACLESLAAADYSFDTLVIDNGSRDSVAPAVRERFPDVGCVELPVNLGYAAGNNVGLRHALANGYDFAFVLNNDTIVDPGFLRAAVGAAADDPRAAAVGGKVLAFDDPCRLWMTYGTVNYRQSLIHLEGWGERDAGQYDTRREVEWVPGCALLLRREALADVGLFDERFFAYHEDVDWCTRARARGWRILFAPDSVVRHRGNRTLGGPTYSSPRKYLSARSTVLFARKHATRAQQVKLWTSIVVTLPFVFLRRLATGEQRGVWLKIRGWVDGLRDREPPFGTLGLR